MMRPEGHTILDLANSLDAAKGLLADMLAQLKELQWKSVDHTEHYCYVDKKIGWWAVIYYEEAVK